MTSHRSPKPAAASPTLRALFAVMLLWPGTGLVRAQDSSQDLVHTASPAHAPNYAVEDGTLGDASYRIVAPPKWNGKLLLIAHGLRAEDAPLTAEFDYGEGTAIGGLLRDGWIVASTSFRRNGWILGEAADDIGALRDKVVSVHGTPATTIVLGTSMGGLIGTIIAEKSDHKAYQGVLAVAAALGGPDDQKLSHTPQIPLLLLSNRSETAGPAAYVKASANGPAVPVLWTVNRDGHANLTEAEIGEGILGLLKYIATGQIAANKDATMNDPVPASTATFDQTGALGTVAHVDAVYGNITTSLVAADLEKIGAQPGARLALRSGSKAAEAPWVKAYADVPKGEWLAFVSADGHVVIARNLASAADGLGVKAGDKVGVSVVKP